MESKEWLKKELKGEACGSLRAMFNTSEALLEARITSLKKSPAVKIYEIVRDDMREWQNELQLTEDDEV